MATITDAQTVALFQILDVPLNTTLNTVSGLGSLTSSTDFSGAGSSAAFTSINTAVTALSAARGVTLAVDLDRWTELGSSVVRLEGGGVGSIQGASMDPNEERKLIRSRVLIILPYYRFHETLARMEQADQGASIPISRL